MSLKHELRVDIPNKVIIKKQNDNSYVYYTVRAFRNSKGRPDNERKSIGKIDKSNGKLIPNDNYFKYIKNSKESENIVFNNATISSIKSFGATYLLGKIFKELGLNNYLENSFGKKVAGKIKTTAMYMCIEGMAMMYIKDFCNNYYLDTPLNLTSPRLSELFSAINHDKRMVFFKQWTKCISEQEYIAYDVTSISSYSKGQIDVEMGYNRDKEKLPQINLGMHFGEKSCLPVFYTKYSGSIVDKSYLTYMMEYNKELDIKNVSFVMDKGFYSKNNLRYMVSNNYPLIMCVSDKLITSKKLLSKYKDKITAYDNYNKDLDVYCIKDQTITYGYKVDTYIYYNPQKAILEHKDLYSKVEKYTSELKQLKTLTNKQIKFYSKFFNIHINDDDSFEFEVSGEKIDIIKDLLGYFVLISTAKNVDRFELLEIYRRKDKVEKAFCNLKNYLDFKRLNTHNLKTTEGKIFIGFISLILKSYIENKLKKYLYERNTSVKMILKELSNIRIVELNGRDTLHTPLTSKQKNILSYFNVNEDEIKNYLRLL